MRGDECHKQVKLVPSTRNKPMHNARNMSKIKTLGESLLKLKGVNFQIQNDTRLSNDERKDEGLYNELRAWKLASGSLAREGYMKMHLQLEQQGEASKKL